MRDRGAPEARGTTRQMRCRLAGAIGLAALLLVALALSPFSPNQDSARAGDSADTGPRQLRLASGETRPSFALPDLDGARHELDPQDGRIVLVHFFATWCEPCREELSSLSHLLDRQGRVPISIVAVNVAEVPARVRRFLETAPVRFPVLLDADRAVTKAWGVSILPTTFVLDRSLAAQLFVEGDIDWTRADVQASLEQVGNVERK